jgi:hypothetical protein
MSGCWQGRKKCSKLPLIPCLVIQKFWNPALEESSLKKWRFAFYQKKSSCNETGRSQEHVQTGLQQHPYINCCYLLTPSLLPQLLQLFRIQKSQKKGLMTLNQQMKEYPNGILIWLVVLYTPIIGTITKHYLKELWSVWVPSDDLEYLVTGDHLMIQNIQ